MKKQIVSVADGILTVEYPTIQRKFTADLAKYSQGVRDAACIHGFKQKFGDAESGKSPMEKFLMVQRIHQNMLDGNWELVSTPDTSGIVIEAVCRIKKEKVAKLEAALAKLTEEDYIAKIKEWASNAKVKAEVAKIRAERAQKAAEESDDDLDIKID